MQNNNGLEKIKINYEKAVKNFVENYILSEKKNGKKIDEINPWAELEKNIIKLANEAADGTNYPTTIQGGTVGLLAIESCLNKIYGQNEYTDYFKNNPVEKRLDEILKNEAKKIIKDAIGDRKKDGVIFDQILRVWLTMIEKYKQYLSLEVVRENYLSKVRTREVDDLEKVLLNEFNNY